MFGQCILSHMGGGGGGGILRRAALFGVIEYGTPQRGRVWEGVPSHAGDFLEIWVLKTSFLVRYKF